MKRRNFLSLVSAGSGGVLLAAPSITQAATTNRSKKMKQKAEELAADVVIAGGGLGGCAAALAACRNGLKVILTEETDWIGGQVSQQGVPPDEHYWIETHGAPASYRDYRNRIRDYYKRNYPLTEEAKSRSNLNPGDGSVSRICHEPRVTVAVLTEMLLPFISTGKLTLLTEHKIDAADVTGDEVKAIRAHDLKNDESIVLNASYFIDATECGDLLPLTGTEYLTGTESKSETGELHAPEVGNPKNNQAFTLCFAMDYQPGVNNVIDRPKDYDFWSNYVPQMDTPWAGKLLDLHYSDPRTLKPKKLGFHPEGKKTGNMLNLWLYRRLINKENFAPGTYDGDITIVNWPQNDYFLGNLIDVSEKEFQKHVEGARQLNLSLFYWLQTEAPRPDGGQGWAGLRLRGDVMGTEDGMAKYPYIREARRIKAEFTVLEEHVGAENRRLVAGDEAGKKSADFYDSVGTGYYHIDLHPSSQGINYVDFGSLPFQIPLGALLPQRMNNVLPANKNVGTTHITNGCFRLHPVEWSIGEAVGMLVAFARQKNVPPRAVREQKNLLTEFQDWIRSQGLETHWPNS
ncbi:FAD-dependent oxidoreductase [Maribellus sp. YY47]|uniref:FAD-dependent oxidoreductase n=1 Tax=Maribellus sp. YY47 TaxID=2929486 RepID=UPI002001263A|nr:FAD-dependent oxidoreductase [Maribellus sp. YY47]MCK3685735.1 FAD-dependent oxidoreductase [Maribellus sp. YY47]